MQPPPTILDEDVYLDALAAIIERDYFPQLSQLRKQNHPVRLDSLSHMLPSQRLKQLETRWFTQQPRKPEMAINMTLHEFQARYTSEDDASFADMMNKQTRQDEEHYNRVYGKLLKDAQPLSTFQNALMYYPTALPHTVPHRAAIVTANTRLDTIPLPRPCIPDTTAEELPFVPSTPLFDPAAMDEPIMTWGEIQDTPIVLSGHSFQLPPTPKRDLLGQKLAHQAANSIRRRHTPYTPRKGPLSPAARQLLSRTVSVDATLRASYSPRPVKHH
jgi:protein DGCR14